jgi:hypothetical protein
MPEPRMRWLTDFKCLLVEQLSTFARLHLMFVIEPLGRWTRLPGCETSDALSRRRYRDQLSRPGNV